MTITLSSWSKCFMARSSEEMTTWWRQKQTVYFQTPVDSLISVILVEAVNLDWRLFRRGVSPNFQPRRASLRLVDSYKLKSRVKLTNAIASLSVILFDGLSWAICNLVFNTRHLLFVRYWRALIVNEYLTQHNIRVLISNWKSQKASRCRFLLVNLTTTMSRPITRYNIVEYHYTPHPQERELILRVQVISHSLHSVPICSCGWRGCCK